MIFKFPLNKIFKDNEIDFNSLIECQENEKIERISISVYRFKYNNDFKFNIDKDLLISFDQDNIYLELEEDIYDYLDDDEEFRVFISGYFDYTDEDKMFFNNINIIDFYNSKIHDDEEIII